MTRRMTYVFSIAIAAAFAMGCGASAPARFYTLRSTATAPGTAPTSYAVLVGPVSVPPAVDRPQFVIQVAPNRVELEEFDRWAAPLDDGIARAVAGDLAILLGTSDVAVAPAANFDPAYRVTIDVQRFESVPGKSVLVEALWNVFAVARGKTQSGRTVAQEAVQGAGFDDVAAAHSRALAKLSSDIAAAIRTAAASQNASEQPGSTGAKKKP